MRRICLKRAAETEPKGFLRGRVSAYRHKLRQNVHTEAEKRRGRQRRPLNVQNTASMNVYSLYRGFNVVVRDLSIPALTP